MSDTEVLRGLLIGAAIKHVAGNDISNEEIDKLWKEAEMEVFQNPGKCKREVEEWRERIQEEDPFLDWFSSVYESL